MIYFLQELALPGWKFIENQLGGGRSVTVWLELKV